MSDISIFSRMLEQAAASAAPVPARPKVIWLSAYERQPGLYVYHVGNKGWAIAGLFTFNLEDARAAAKHLGQICGRPVREYGPPAAFGRQEAPPAAVVDAFWYMVRLGDKERLRAWLAARPDHAPVLLRLLEREQ